MIFGDIKTETKHLPFLIYKILKHLKEEVESGKRDPQAIISAFYDLDNPLFFEKKWINIKPQMNELKVKK